MAKAVWISASIASELCDLGRDSFPLETGGMLLGYEADNGDAVVTAFIGPGPKARHMRYRFIPDAEYQQAELDAHYAHTNGVETYLGDWHTHPLGSSEPSITDKKTLTRIAMTPASGTALPVMAILGGGPEQWNFGAVRFLSVTKRLFFSRYELLQLQTEIY